MIGEALSSLKNFLGTERCYLEQKDNRSNIVILDAVDSESWGSSVSLTQHTIENGKSITEHISENKDTVTIRATITNHTGISMLDPLSLTRAVGLDVKDVINERLDQLNTWAKNGIPLIYYGAIKEPLQNCLITRLTPSKNATIGEAVDLDIELQRLKVADEDLGIELISSVKKLVRKGLANSAIITAAVSSKNNRILGI